MLRLFAAIICISFFVSCSNDFDLTEGKSEVPVVYGLLSPNDTAIYIRVEKSFVDEDVNPKTLAQDPANLYYDNVTVELKNLNIPSQVYTLDKVDGNLEGYVRDAGFFANAPNFLYKLHKNKLVNGVLGDTTPYELTIKQPDGQVLAKAKTRVLRKMINSDIASPAASGSLFFDYNKDFTLAFRPDPFSHIHDIFLAVTFAETKNGVTMDKVVKWPITRNYVANSPNNLVISYSVSGRNFYEFLKANLEEDPTITRFLRTGAIEIYSGGVELKDYINIVKANIGITSSGEVPSYTNIENGIGLLSSRTSVIRSEISFTQATRDSIINGIITKSLNFR